MTRSQGTRSAAYVFSTRATMFLQEISLGSIPRRMPYSLSTKLQSNTSTSKPSLDFQDRSQGTRSAAYVYSTRATMFLQEICLESIPRRLTKLQRDTSTSKPSLGFQDQEDGKKIGNEERSVRFRYVSTGGSR